MRTTRQLVVTFAIAVTAIALVGSVQADGLCHGGGRGIGGGGYGGRGAGITVGGARIGVARGGKNNNQNNNYGMQQPPVYGGVVAPVAPVPKKVVTPAPVPAPQPAPAVVKQATPAPKPVATVQAAAVRPQVQVSTVTNVMPVESLPPVDQTAAKPAQPVVAEAPLPQVPVGATITLQGKDLSDKPGQVMLQLGEVSLPATIKEWTNDSVTCTLPMLGLTKPSKATLHVITADGKTASSLPCELVTSLPTTAPQVVSK